MSIRKAQFKVDVKQNKNAGEGELRRKFKRRTTRRQVVEEAEVDRREAELVAGHGMYRLIAFVSTSATDVEGRPALDGLARQSGEIERLANKCSLELARLYGEQDQGFSVAALPFGRGLR